MRQSQSGCAECWCLPPAQSAREYGGEEFALVLPEISIENARRKAETLRQRVKSLALEHRGTPLGSISISLGVAVFPIHAEDAESLFRRADQALYEAKNAGLERVVVAQSAPPRGELILAPA